MFWKGNCAPFGKLELAFRNQLAQTNGVLFRRPRGTSENRIALANRTIDGDLLMVRCHYSRGSGKWRVFFASIDYNTIFVAQNRVKRDVCLFVRTLIIFKSFKKEKQVSVQSGSPIRQSDLLRNPPVEWMSRLSSYQEDLVQPDRSILYKHNYLGLLKSVTRLCAPRTVSSGIWLGPAKHVTGCNKSLSKSDMGDSGSCAHVLRALNTINGRYGIWSCWTLILFSSSSSK